MQRASCAVARDNSVGLLGGVERLVAQLINVGVELGLKGVDAAQGVLR